MQRTKLFGFIATLGATLVLALPALAQEQAAGEAQVDADAAAPDVPEAKSLEELIQMVKDGWKAEQAENRRREADFRTRKAEQAQLLAEAQGRLAAAEALSERLDAARLDARSHHADKEASGGRRHVVVGARRHHANRSRRVVARRSLARRL